MAPRKPALTLSDVVIPLVGRRIAGEKRDRTQVTIFATSRLPAAKVSRVRRAEETCGRTGICHVTPPLLQHGVTCVLV
ncbi:unnamed protein product [Ixodes pacificus]